MNYTEYTGTYTGQKFEKGIEYRYRLVIPDADVLCGIYLGHDDGSKTDEETMIRLAEEGKAPHCMFIGMGCGSVGLCDNTNRGVRMVSYDMFTREYSDFLVLEMIPELVKRYHVNVSDNPDWHMTAGGSSGGISAFMIAWFHPEFFRRIYMASPSFLAMCRGNEVPYLIRKFETKPFRVYEEYSENEPNDYFGTSYCVAKEAEMAMEFAGYDYCCKYFPGEGHSARYNDAGESRIRLEWLWNDYQNTPVKPLGRSTRARTVMSDDSVWERADHFPGKTKPTLTVLSADQTMEYSATTDCEEMYATTVGGGTKFLMGMMHTYPAVYPKGALDMAVNEVDRIFVLTEIGVQCFRSYGLVDVILDLPGEKPELIAFGEGDEADMLFVKTADGCWKRKMLGKGRGIKPTQPRHRGYYDG